MNVYEIITERIHPRLHGQVGERHGQDEHGDAAHAALA